MTKNILHRIQVYNSRLICFGIKPGAALGVMMASIFIIACGKKDSNSPGVEYMPDMYRSPSFETYSANPNFDDGSSARKSVPGTVARNHLGGESYGINEMPYPYSNDTSGYSNAGKFLKNPLPLTPEVFADGEELYKKFCTHCHGVSGAGDGLVGAKLPGPPPAYTSGALLHLLEGKMFHTMTYGKGLMGSHASQLCKEDRWKLVYYIQHLQQANMPPPLADSTKSATTKAKINSIRPEKTKEIPIEN